MYLRVTLKEALNSLNPDYSFCGQGFFNLDTSDWKCTISVNGTPIVDTNDLSQYITNVNYPITLSNGTEIENVFLNPIGVSTNDCEIKIKLNVEELCIKNTVKIVLEKNGYKPFQLECFVWGYDIGNSQIDGITHNPPFEIILVPDFVDDNGTLVDVSKEGIASAIFLVEPYSNTIYGYKSNNSRSKTEYGVLYNGNYVDYKICDTYIFEPDCKKYDSSNSTYTFRVVSHFTKTCCCGCREEDKFCTATYPVFTYNFYPSLSLYHKLSNTCSCGDCITTSATKEIAPNLSFSMVDFIWKNDEKVSPYFKPIKYEIYISSIFNSQNITLSGLIDASLYPIQFSPLTYLKPYEINEKGDYIIYLKIKNSCFICNYKEEIKVCNPIRVEEVSCGVYKLYNYSLDKVEFTLKEVDKEYDSYVVKDTYILESCTTKEITLTDGIYYLEYGKVEPNPLFIGGIVLGVFCKFRNCIGDITRQILCSCDCSCPETIEKRILKVNTAYLSFLMYLNTFNNTFNIDKTFVSLSPKYINLLYESKKNLTLLEKLCFTCQDGSKKPCNCKD